MRFRALATLTIATVLPLAAPAMAAEPTVSAYSWTETAKVSIYGDSYTTWLDEPWLSHKRLQHRHGWDVVNAGQAGLRSPDIAHRVIGGNSPWQWQAGARRLAMFEQGTNDLLALGMAGVEQHRNALRAELLFASLEGPIDSANAQLSGTWQANAGEWFGGTHLTGQGTATLWGGNRAGKWAFGYYRIPRSTGGTFQLYADSALLGSYSTANDCYYSAYTARNWCATAAVVTLPGPAQTFRIVHNQPGLEGPHFDWYGKVNEDPALRFVVPVQPYLSAAGKAAFPLATDATVDAYNAATRSVAAEVGPWVKVVELPGWMPEAHMLGDGVHPNEQGHRLIADAIDAVLQG